MKNCIVLLMMLCLARLTSAQYLVINDSEGYMVPVQDTLVSLYTETGSCCFNKTYQLDLDMDESADVTFDMSCYFGGGGGSTEIEIETHNDFYVHVDTTFVEHFQYVDDSYEVHDATRITPVVNRYIEGDTIFSNPGLFSKREVLSRTGGGSDPPCTYNNVDLFIGETSWVAFENSNGNLYWLKIYIPNSMNLQIISARTNAPPDPEYLDEIKNRILYPNPADDIVYFREVFDSVEIYTVDGAFLEGKELPDVEWHYDTSHLEKGMYFIHLTKGDVKITLKLLKE